MSEPNFLIGSGMVAPPAESMLAIATNPHQRQVIRNQNVTLENGRRERGRINDKAKPIQDKIQKQVNAATKRLANLEDAYLNPKTDPKEKERLGKDIQLQRDRIRELMESQKAVVEQLKRTDPTLKRLDTSNIALNTINKAGIYGISLANPQGSGFVQEYIGESDKGNLSVEQMLGSGGGGGGSTSVSSFRPALGFTGFTFFGR